jgi:hypothetical protein
MQKRDLAIALILLSVPLFAEQRTSTNRASATLQINIFVRPSINTPPPAVKQEDRGVIFNLAPKSKLDVTREQTVLPREPITQPERQKDAVLRTTTYTAE